MDAEIAEHTQMNAKRRVTSWRLDSVGAPELDRRAIIILSRTGVAAVIRIPRPKKVIRDVSKLSDTLTPQCNSDGLAS
jgi:hypothetical protein